MSFADILASMGETGELGENPRLSLDAGEAKERRIRPGTGDAGEQFAPIRPAFARPNPAPINEIRPIRPIRPDERDHEELTRLVRLCGTYYSFTPDEHADALAIALADPVNAITCFRGMAARLQPFFKERTCYEQ